MSIFPIKLWKLFKALNTFFFMRLIFIRIYCGLENQTTKVFNDSHSKPTQRSHNNRILKRTLAALVKSIFNKSKFVSLGLYFFAKTSSHYAGCNPGFRKHIKHLESKNIFINDSSLWIGSPTKSPTLTIMASAYLQTKKILT